MAEPVLRMARQEPSGGLGPVACGSRGNTRIHIGGEDGMLGCTGANLQSPASRSKLRPPQNLTNFAAVPPAVYAVADDVSDGCTGANLQSHRRLVVADGTTASALPAHASPRGLDACGGRQVRDQDLGVLLQIFDLLHPRLDVAHGSAQALGLLVQLGDLIGRVLGVGSGY